MNNRSSRLRAAMFWGAMMGLSACFRLPTVPTMYAPRPDAATENVGDIHCYWHRHTFQVAQPRGPASPALRVPEGSREIGVVEARGNGRVWESDYYERLSREAGEMGGSHFVIVRSFYLAGSVAVVAAVFLDSTREH